MKTAPARLSTIMFALMASSLAVQAKTVSLFYDGIYVQTNASSSEEAYNMKLSLESLGSTVSTFTGITSNDFATALSGVDTLIIPELEIGNLGAALAADAIGVISNFVAAGNTLILNADGFSNDDTLINSVFGYSISSGGSSSPSAISSGLVGTVFDGGPPSLPANNGLYPWTTSTLPVGTLSAYGFTSGVDYTTVAQISHGAGRIILLAYDWFDAAPNGSQDGGWNEILYRALATAGLVGDFYVDITSTNAVFPYDSWATAATNIQHAVTIADDGSTVHVNNGTYLLTSEIVVGSDILVQSVNGPSVTAVDGGGVARGFNLGSSACTISGFTIQNGYTSGDGGGVYCANNTAPILTNCVLSGNSSVGRGGGMWFGTANNCIISGNASSGSYGGGLAYSKANNCLVVGNTSASDGAGLDSVTAVNCTVVSNVCTGSGGGIFGGTARNSIVTGNSPSEFAVLGTTEYTCSPALIHGVDGNITNPPAFVNPGAGDYRLTVGSPCLDAGFNGYASGATDLDDAPRIMNLVVDMGAYELLPLDHYVSAAGSHEYPFETWDRAATNIQDAVDAAPDGHTVHVTNDTYNLTSEIVVSSDILVQSVNGPQVTIIDGGGAVRGFNLGSSACIVSGFTIQNGYTSGGGGGVVCDNNTPILAHCVLSGNSCDSIGGGMLRGTANNCVFNGNSAPFGWGGGKAIGTANNCLVVGNTSAGDGAGLDSVTAVNCTIVLNVCTGFGGGIYAGTTRNSIVTGNSPSEFAVLGTTEYTCSPALIDGVNGNITSAPAFINPGGGNFRLKYGSPCINAADNAYAFGSVDLDWTARIVDVTVDMGAYEYDVAVYDSDGDTLVDIDELNVYCSSPLLTNTDGDAFDDAYEVANGFAPHIFTDMPGYLADNAESFGFYTQSEVLDLGVGDIGGMVTTNGTIDLWVQLWQSDDLITWTNAGPPVMWSEPVDSSVKLYRVGVDN
jgi:hypothetical protein